VVEGVKQLPLQKQGTAQDVADAVAFLLNSGFITGQTVYVDGGRHLNGTFYG
jgi:enoyl-[acyl-carrier-protein] reductase (NADH)